MPILIALHALAATVWVGGMFFALFVLRPTTSELLEASTRLSFWCKALRRFFLWVWLAILLLPITGFWMIFVHLGGIGNVGWHIHAMLALSIVMILLFLHLFFAPYRRLRRAADMDNCDAGAQSLNQIRRLIGINLTLGLIIIAIAVAGKNF